MKKTLFIFFFLFLGLLHSSGVYANNPDQPHSSLSASGSFPADGKTQATITVTLLDKFGNPVVGHSVNISDPNNSTVGITTVSGTTSSSGQATFSITSSLAQTDNLNILDITSGSVLNGLGTVTFYSIVPTAAGACSNPPPGSYPVLTSAVASGQNQITLTWLPAASPVTYYVLVYGTSSGNYMYGNPNIGNGTSYTVSYLNPGKKYYFAIRGVNICTPGSYSNELSAVTQGGGTTSSYAVSNSAPAAKPVVSLAVAKPATNALPTSPAFQTSVQQPIQSQKKYVPPVPKSTQPQKTCFLFICW